ncbi:hypothetical protein PF005_g11667 [Phytophthora fragariae]|uniref:Secreted protein n=2 Tax=Phytophthora TaxID=4783 RepID=A0A6A3M031_9STRA|nr:hypothetical protein PF003_g23750 [Phytophthora fragariae]KAE9039811.1 hypothetical protein PR002_g5279 [Phytophthora rubi]KAE8937134.1 hypothetical protein PF009_g12950 [Phytophthora fragariae]KAE9023660.1 hypothetical protein PF011_g3872 [Phytophthora fragariae]KAE9044713.1 hypothetical protein PR001_g5248 [Phytophthora rubi]
MGNSSCVCYCLCLLFARNTRCERVARLIKVQLRGSACTTTSGDKSIGSGVMMRTYDRTADLWFS